MYRYYSLHAYLKNRFGKKVYKLALNAGFSCPNRDGTKGVGGCIFCSAGGSGEFAVSGKSILRQLEEAKAKIAAKIPEKCGYIAYFQAFTNTYAPAEQLRRLFFEAAEAEDIEAISVATRPDCLPPDILTLLTELNRRKPVWVEMGLQTSNEETARLINRCYENECFSRAVRELKQRNIEVIAHVILGLPGETNEDMLRTVRFACDCGIDGIKLQLLHVLKNTPLAQMEYTPLTMAEYFDIVAACIEIIPPRVVIHRLTGDGDKRLLLAPAWSADKHRVLNGLLRVLDERNIFQGSKCGGNKDGQNAEF